MGFNDTPEMNYVQRFRWTLGSDNLPESFVKNVSFEFIGKKLTMEYYEVMVSGEEELPIHKWLRSDLKNEVLRFTTYDGLGNVIYSYDIDGIRILSDRANFGYDLSCASTRMITIGFENCRNSLVKHSEKTKFVFSILGESKKYDVELESLPSLTVEQETINFLNTYKFIPGKAVWDELDVTLIESDITNFRKLYNNQESFNAEVVYYSQCGKPEYWTLLEARVLSISNELKPKMKLSFNHARYSLKRNNV